MHKKEYRVPAVDKALKVIQVLCESPAPMTLTEIAKAIDSNNNMVTRILGSLEAESWVIQEHPGPRYRMSLRPLYYTNMPLNRLDLVNASKEAIHNFWERHGECCFLGVLDDDRVLYLEALDQTAGPVKVAVSRGGRYIIHTAAPGKVLMAYDDQACEKLLENKLERFTENTICTKKDFRQEMKKIRENSYALDDEEGARGLICMAVPIFNHEQKVVASFGISVLTTNYENTDVMFQSLGQDVINVGKTISASLGYVEE